MTPTLTSNDSEDSDISPLPAVVAVQRIASPSFAKESFYAMARPFRYSIAQATRSLRPKTPTTHSSNAPIVHFQSCESHSLQMATFLSRHFAQFLRCPRKAYRGDPDLPALGAAVAAVSASAFGALDTPELRFTSYRLLWALQWSCSGIPQSPTAIVVGTLFDAITLRRVTLRSLGHVWMRRASYWTECLGRECGAFV